MAEQCLRRIFTCCLAAVCLVIVYLSRIDTRTWRQPFRIAPATRHSLYPTNWTLIDLKRFEFLLNSDVCAEGDSVKLLLSVTSHPGHVALRQAFRRALPSHILEEFAIRRVFVLAKINPIQKGYDQVSQTVVEQEHILYGDIVQGDFLESYRNLSYKHVLGLKYALHYCPQTSFVLKMDDDTAVDLFRMLALLETLGTQESLTIVGSLMNINERKVLRDLDSKWYVTYDEYPSTIYPNFVSGWAYGTTLKAVERLVKCSEQSPMFWIDDVYVTGLLANLSEISYINVRSRLTPFLNEIRCCVDRPRVQCDFIIGPTDEVHVFESFYRNTVNCHVSKCERPNVNQSKCMYPDKAEFFSQASSHVVQGQVIPLSLK